MTVTAAGVGRLAPALNVVTDSVVLVLLGLWGLSAVHRRPCR
jgi:hypothetical protein